MKRFLPPLVVLFVTTLSLGITASLWVHERRSENARLRAIFDFNLRQTATRIEQRIANYEQMLRGVQGLFAIDERLDRGAFEDYVDAVIAGPDAAGLQAFAYERLLHPAEVAAHLAAMRAAGLGDYAIDPPGERELYAPMTWIAPAAARKAGYGFDPLTEPTRRAAMLQASDSGNSALTQRLTLKIDGDRSGSGETGFLMFVPIYEKGRPTATIAQRREHTSGWVSASFRVSGLMSTLYGEESPGLVVRLFDGADTNAAALMYSSAPAPRGAARFEAQEYIAFAGRAWTLQLSSLPEFERQHGQDTDQAILVAGVGLTLLLGALTHQLVTARRRATAVAQAMTRELRESEARYRRIVETASEGIWIVDVQRRIAFVNPRIAQWLGTTEAAMRGRPLDDFMDAAEAERCRAALESATPDGVGAVELELRRTDGSNTWVAVAFRPIVDDAGRPAGALGMLTDINERRQAEERRAVLEAQLRESQKMEAIGTLAGGIAHDFNNILAAIIGNLAAARQEGAQGASNDASLAKVERSALRARSLVQQILTFSRTQSHVLQAQPLQTILEETLQMLRALMPASAELVVHLPAEPVLVRTDVTQMQQVVMNLCTNAWQSLPGGLGRVDVGLEALPDGAPEDLAGPAAAGPHLPSGPLAHLWVADTGCGMDEATRSRVFEPFFTTKQVGHGTGLGLAVVHGIVVAHGGTIRVRSAPGAGTRFDLHFPLQTATDHEAVDAAPEASAVPRGHGEHILCIDDDPAMALMMEGLLLRAGYRVTAFGHPHDALDAVRAEPGEFDLCVTDYNMPDLNGMELARALAAVAPAMPVVVTSGYISDEMRARAEAQHVGALLQKEYTLERLPGLVHALLEGRRGAT